MERVLIQAKPKDEIKINEWIKRAKKIISQNMSNESMHELFILYNDKMLPTEKDERCYYCQIRVYESVKNYINEFESKLI